MRASPTEQIRVTANIGAVVSCMAAVVSHIAMVVSCMAAVVSHIAAVHSL